MSIDMHYGVVDACVRLGYNVQRGVAFGRLFQFLIPYMMACCRVHTRFDLTGL